MEVTNCFTAVMMELLLGKCSLHGPSFISLNRWKSEGTKSGLYSECGSPAKIGSVLHGFQTGMDPGVIVMLSSLV